MTPRDRRMGLADELYAEAAEFLGPAAEYAPRETNCLADTARTHTDRSKDAETGEERVAAH